MEPRPGRFRLVHTQLPVGRTGDVTRVVFPTPKLSRGIWLLLPCALLNAGCSSSDDSGSSSDEGPGAVAMADADAAAEQGLVAQQQILADGKVTAAEYEDAINLAFSCFQDSGLDPKGPWPSPIDGLSYFIDVEYPIDMTEFASPTGVSCEETYLKYVQPNYLEQNEHVMAPNLLEVVQERLAEQGIETSPDDTNVEMMAETAGGQEMYGPVSEVVVTAVNDLYPEITGGIFVTF